MATTHSCNSDPSLSMTRSDYLSTLPLWRRCLAMLNWRPVYDIEQRTRRLKLETEQIRIEAEQIRIETEQRRIENKRLAALESRLDALLRRADSSSSTPPTAGPT